MTTQTLLASAKINLYLEILGDRPDGFHELVMIMQSVDLCDRITLRSLKTPTIALKCDHPLVPVDESNLAHRAAMLLVQQFPGTLEKHGGVEITIEKNIPVGAGLAGGSTNAAAVLVGLDMLWELGLSQPMLQELGATLGSDVPFCILGGAAIATGRGESLDSITGIDHAFVVLAKYESLSVSTPWAYKSYRQQFSQTYIPVTDQSTLAERQARVHSGVIVKALAKQDLNAIGQSLHNDLEKVVLPAHEKVAELRRIMALQGGLGTMMSGSGPTVFTLAQTQVAAENILSQVERHFNDPDLKLWVAQFSTTGIRLT
jgi:4-diphosphocytidyl-2-C-methyl-D-erythritol kinase